MKQTTLVKLSKVLSCVYHLTLWSSLALLAHMYRQLSEILDFVEEHTTTIYIATNPSQGYLLCFLIFLSIVTLISSFLLRKKAGK